MKKLNAKLKEAPVQKITFKGREYWLKRDDLINHYFNGNKARKFQYFLEKDLSQYTTVASYGGNQSNAMYSLSAFAKIKGLKFDYYVKPISKWLKENPVGNFKAALEMGMNYIEIDDYEDFFQRMSKPKKTFHELGKDTLLIRQGGAEKEAEYGVKILADEINSFAKEKGIKDLSVFIQSGTGTTAVFLQKHLNHRVYTTPNIGDSEYLRKQFSLLVEDEKLHPTILESPKKYQFGKLYPEFYNIWKEINEETGIEFELLYDPVTLIVMNEYQKNIKDEIMYIHSGGTFGNESMINRYNRFFKINS